MKQIALSTRYYSPEHGLVHTVCRAIDEETGEVKIAFVRIGVGGIASEVYLSSEDSFRERFIGD